MAESLRAGSLPDDRRDFLVQTGIVQLLRRPSEILPRDTNFDLTGGEQAADDQPSIIPMHEFPQPGLTRGVVNKCIVDQLRS